MKKCMLDNKGFSLVEIIVAMGISAFVVLATYMLMNTASVSYSDSSEDIDVQKEVMHSMNFLYDKLAEAKKYKIVDYEFAEDGKTADGILLVVSSTEYEGYDAKDVTCLFVYNPLAKEGALYYMKVDEAYNGLSDVAIEGYATGAQENKYLLAENVKVFDVSDYSANSPVKVNVKVEALKSKISYSENKIVYPRNNQE